MTESVDPNEAGVRGTPVDHVDRAFLALPGYQDNDLVSPCG